MQFTESVEEMATKGHFDDELEHLPKISSSAPGLDGLVIFLDTSSSNVVTKFYKHRPEVESALRSIEVQPGQKVLVLGDRDGSLSAGIGNQDTTIQVDVIEDDVTRSAIALRNHTVNPNLTQVRILEDIELELADDYDLIIYSPQSFDSSGFYESVITSYSKRLKQNGQMYVITHKNAGATAKLTALQELLDPESEILDRSKGGIRVLRAIKKKPMTAEIEPIRRTVEFTVLGTQIAAESEESLFSPNDLDHGTRLLLETVGLERLRTAQNVLDYGCSWGAIGLTAATVNPNCRVTMVDISKRAIRLVADNARYHGFEDRINPVCTDDLFDIPGSYDVILTNPPFHSTTRNLIRFFKNARQKLSKSGEMYVVVEESYRERFDGILYEVFGDRSYSIMENNGAYSVFKVRKTNSNKRRRVAHDYGQEEYDEEYAY